MFGPIPSKQVIRHSHQSITASLRRYHWRFILFLIMFCTVLSLLVLLFRPVGAQATCQTQHLVQRGDTLSKIGQRYGIRWTTIAQANNLGNPDRIYAGQYLCIPAVNSPTPPPAGCQIQYTVQRGDTLARIGERYGLEWTRLAQLNNLANANLIYTGQKLCIPTGASPSPTPQKIPTISIVSVVPGQSVTIRTAHYPANQQFDVLMGAYGSKGINGTWVTSTNSGLGGSFTATYSIPAAWRGADRIAIRLQSSSGYYSFNWFNNR